MTERKMVSTSPKPTGNVGRSLGDSNKKSILAPGLKLKGKTLGQGQSSLGSQAIAGSAPEPEACGCLMESAPSSAHGTTS